MWILSSNFFTCAFVDVSMGRGQGPRKGLLRGGGRALRGDKGRVLEHMCFASTSGSPGGGRA